MKTATQILESKGYESDHVNEVLNSLDEQVRDKFKVTEPVHLWETYTLGDANKDNLQKIAEENNFEDIDELLENMDWELLELTEKYGE